MPSAWSHASPSQIKTFRRCGKKWYWNKIEGLPTPTHPAAALGTALHAELESYLLGKTALGRLSSCLQPGVDFNLLPEPKDVHKDDVERRLEISEGLAVPMWMVIDLVEPQDNRITDHKTSSSHRYTKTEEELREDPQAIVYSWAATQQLGFDFPIEFRHVYYRTKGRPSVRESSVTFSEEGLKSQWNSIVETVEEMSRCAVIPVEEVSHDTDACKDYGGCPFAGRCALIGVAPLGGLTFASRANTGAKNMTDITEKLKERREAQQKAAFPPKPPKHLTKPKAQEVPPSTEINPPDGTPMDEPVSLKPASAPEQDSPPDDDFPSRLAELLDTPERCKEYILRKGYRGERKTNLLAILDRVSEVCEVELPRTGTKARLHQALDSMVSSIPNRTAVADSPSVLYINCLPRKGGSFDLLDEFLLPFQEAVAEASQLVHYNLLDYNQGAKQVASFVYSAIAKGEAQLPRSLFADRRNPSTDAVVEVLVPHYDLVVERT